MPAAKIIGIVPEMFTPPGKDKMWFVPNPDALHRATAAADAAKQLTAWLQGRERAYAVHDVLRDLEARFGCGASIPCCLIRDALALPLDQEDARAALVTKALDLIDPQVRLHEATEQP